MPPALPESATATWYSDPSDPRCPHDAWLIAFEVSETGIGDRLQDRTNAISVRLLGAYHDGEIAFRYSGVSAFSTDARPGDEGLGDWLENRFELIDTVLIRHLGTRSLVHHSGRSVLRVAALRAYSLTHEV